MITSCYKNDNDILALDFDKAKDTVYFDIRSVINEFSLQTRVNIKGKITDLFLTTETDVGGMMMANKTAIINDESGFARLTMEIYMML